MKKKMGIVLCAICMMTALFSFGIVYAEDERQAGFRLLAGKYAPELTEEALDTYIKSCAEEATVVRIEVEYIAGKANRGAAMG